MTTANIIPSLNSPDLCYHLISAATTNATSVKATPGLLMGYTVFNINASVRYLKIYNKASAPTVGTDTPVITVGIPALSGNNYTLPHAVSFPLGIAVALTTGMADTDTGAVSLNETAVHLFYK